MDHRPGRLLIIAVLGAAALAGCTPVNGGTNGTAIPTAPTSAVSTVPGSPASGAPQAATTPAAASAASTPAPNAADLTNASSTLGQIVVDGTGRTVYVFDRDVPNSGQSQCTGSCLSTWTPVITANDPPNAVGLPGVVGVITTAAGMRQLTINGQPLYRYSADTAPGDVKGQGIDGTWWVVDPTGVKVKGAHATSGY